MKNSIEVRELSHRFREKQVLNQIELTVEDGEIFGLLGPSGAGKTTLIRILTGQLAQTEGEAYLRGMDTRRLSREMYKEFGMVMDNTGLYERLSCYDNLHLFARIYHLPKRRVYEALEQTGLSEAVKRPVSKLSKGMRQRLMLARAILHKPGFLFLDEPTGGLDPGTAREIHDLIWEQQKRGCTIFLTTHNMEEATKLCSHVALLYQGKIVEYGNPEEICRRYNHQNQIRVQLQDGQIRELKNNPESAEQIRDYFATGTVVTIHSSEPNLETVFVELTGRRFQ